MQAGDRALLRDVGATLLQNQALQELAGDFLLMIAHDRKKLCRELCRELYRIGVADAI